MRHSLLKYRNYPGAQRTGPPTRKHWPMWSWSVKNGSKPLENLGVTFRCPEGVSYMHSRNVRSPATLHAFGIHMSRAPLWHRFTARLSRILARSARTVERREDFLRWRCFPRRPPGAIRVGRYAVDECRAPLARRWQPGTALLKSIPGVGADRQRDAFLAKLHARPVRLGKESECETCSRAVS